LRVSLLPFANLSAESGLDWLTDAGTLAAAAALEGVPGLQVTPARTPSDAIAAGAERLVHVTFRPEGQRLELNWEIETLPDRTMDPTGRLTAADPVAGLNALAEALRNALGATGAPLKRLPTESVEAWASFAAGRFEEAAAKDPRFGLAWRAWAEQTLGSGDRKAAAEIVTRALAEDRRFSEPDRLKLRVIRARANGDRGELADAAAEAARSHPADAAVLAEAGAAAVAVRRYDQGIAFYTAVLKLDPNNLDAWNNLGYAQAYSGNLAAGMEALKQYQQRAPNAANALDSMGELQMRAGKFADAAQLFLSAAQKEPGFINGFEPMKAAFARLFAGDTAAAGQLFEQYIKGRQGPAGQIERLAWLRATGRAADAKAMLNGVGDAGKQLGFLWQLEEGTFPGTARGLPEGYQLVASKNFKEAESWWRTAWERSAPGADGTAREMLAWCLVENGKNAEAAKLLDVWPVPQAATELVAPFFYVPRTLYVRAAALGQGDEAKRLYALYLKLSESQGDGYGMRAKAAAAQGGR
jgi:tetratricopeptide (TPR) repeat protein